MPTERYNPFTDNDQLADARRVFETNCAESRKLYLEGIMDEERKKALQTGLVRGVITVGTVALIGLSAGVYQKNPSIFSRQTSNEKRVEVNTLLPYLGKDNINNACKEFTEEHDSHIHITKKGNGSSGEDYISISCNERGVATSGEFQSNMSGLQAKGFWKKTTENTVYVSQTTVGSSEELSIISSKYKGRILNEGSGTQRDCVLIAETFDGVSLYAQIDDEDNQLRAFNIHNQKPSFNISMQETPDEYVRLRIKTGDYLSDPSQKQVIGAANLLSGLDVICNPDLSSVSELDTFVTDSIRYLSSVQANQ